MRPLKGPGIENTKNYVAPDLIRGLLANHHLYSDREWTPDQVRGCGSEVYRQSFRDLAVTHVENHFGRRRRVEG
ncbi:hypothetical protein NBRC116588_15950 [Pyruvatibacter sp. HU-CL02332]